MRNRRNAGSSHNSERWRKTFQVVPVSVAVILVAVGTPAFAQFNVGFSTLPLDGGARNEGTVSYQWNERFATSFQGVLESTATNDEVAGFPDSLLYTEEEVMDLSLYPLEYGLVSPQAEFSVGAGLNYNRRSVLEKGNFVFNDPQVFNNEYTADRYGAAANAHLRFGAARFALEYSTSFVPLYFFSFQQDISIQPLVSDDRSYSTFATGGLAWQQAARLGLWRFLQMEATYDLDILSFDILNLSYDGSEYLFEAGESDTLVQTFRGFANLIIPVSDESGLSVGGGYEFSTLIDRAASNSNPLEESRWIYKVEYGQRL